MNFRSIVKDTFCFFDKIFFKAGKPLVSVVRLKGTIGVSGLGSRSLNLTSLEKTLENAFSKRHLSAVAIIVNSPGGSPVQSDAIAMRIRQLSIEKQVPVYAFVEDVAASGGYWLACSADEIYANSMSIIGSIGVISASFGFSEFIQKLGIERRVYAQGDNKSMLDPFKPEDSKEVKKLLGLQTEIHKEFKSYVKLRRKNAKLSGGDKALFSGDVWTGSQAVKNGLIDGIGELRHIMKEKLGKNTRFIFLQPDGNWFQRKFSSRFFLQNDLGFGEGILTAIEERSLWSRFGL